MRPLFLLLFLLALSGCSGMGAEACAVADWRAIGYEDGAKGLGPAARPCSAQSRRYLPKAAGPWPLAPSS